MAPPLIGDEGPAGGSLMEEVGDVHGLPGWVEGPGISSRQHQQLVGKACQVLNVGHLGLYRLTVFLIRARLRQVALELVQHQSQWRAQLMRSVSREPPKAVE